MSDFAGAIKMFGGLSLRFSRPSDQDFLLNMFMAARPWLDFTSDDRDFVRNLYEEQLRITRHGLGDVYPDHLDFIVEKTGQAVGHLNVDLHPIEWRITLLEIHPQARRKGIGRDVVRSLQAAAGNGHMPLTVSTPIGMAEPLAFWHSLDFQVVAQQPPMLGLAWMPPSRRAPVQPSLVFS